MNVFRITHFTIRLAKKFVKIVGCYVKMCCIYQISNTITARLDWNYDGCRGNYNDEKSIFSLCLCVGFRCSSCLFYLFCYIVFALDCFFIIRRIVGIVVWLECLGDTNSSGT